jgi:Skp family chaperone for outer membrane proteins
MSLSSRFALDRSGDIGWQFLRPSQRMADSRHFQLPRRDLTSGLSVFASGAERTLVADEHATEDRRRTLFRLPVKGCFVLLVLTIVLPPARAWAQPNLRIAFFDPERAFQASADGKAAIARITALRDEKARAVDEKDKALAAQEQVVKQNAATLSEPARAAQTASVEKFRLDVERFIQDAQTELQGVQRDVESAFLAKLKPAVDKVVATKGLQLVLRVDASLVVWIDPVDDMTADVVKQLEADATRSSEATGERRGVMVLPRRRDDSGGITPTRGSRNEERN